MAKRTIPARWRKLFKAHLPKYDPIATAGSGDWFDAAEAELKCDFFPDCLTHIKGEWAEQPFALDDWQRALVGCLFGWKRADGTRRYRTLYLEVPKKNGKSTLGAGIGLVLTFADHEPGAEVYSVAADREQAAIVFDTAKAMVKADPDLNGMSELFRRAIRNGASTYKVSSADAPTKHGLNASGVVFDELHAQPNRDLYDTLSGAGAARRQPLHSYITTSGYDKLSVCYEVHTYATKVREGIVQDSSFLPVIYAVDPEVLKEDPSAWTKEATWAAANPGFGVSVKPDYLRELCRKAQESPALENTFKRLHLDIWTEQATRWLQMHVWDENTTSIVEAEFAGMECWGGLDLSSTTDISACVWVFKRQGGYALVPRFWVPESKVEAARKQRGNVDHVPYDIWAQQGFVRVTEGEVIDYDIIRRDVKADGKVFNVQEIAIDRWNATQLSTQLDGDGFTVVPFGQGFASMSAPSKAFEEKVVARQLYHGQHPVLRWMAANVARKEDAAGNIKPDKSVSTGRIDGIVAAVMGIGRASVATHSGSVYDGRGLVTI